MRACIVVTAILLLCAGAVAQNAAATSSAQPAPAAQQAPPPRPLDPAPGGMPFVHDPSTVIRSHGLYYVYTTGRGMPFLSSPDGVNWTRQGSVFSQIPERVHAAVPKNNGLDVWAPDIIRVGSTFYLYYAVSSWGSFNSAVALATNTTLDPKDAAYKWVDRGVVVSSDGAENMNAIDPGVVMAPDGTMWICYGSYHGDIKVLQLDPKTGLALAGEKAKATAVTIARESEASDIIFHDGSFYLFVNHGSCCKGKNSEYNIRVGRSHTVSGPYLDKHGIPMTEGGGSLFLAAHDHRIGPGHFGRVIEEDTVSAARRGPERFSLHYEADLTNGGRPTLGIRPLLWSVAGWPVAGDTLATGNYKILAQASEDSLGLQSPAQVTTEGDARVDTAQTGSMAVHLVRYLAVPTQQWTITPAGGEYWKIINSGTQLALGTRSNDASAIELSAYVGADAQMWHLDQWPDGSYHMWNKATGASLTSSNHGEVAMATFVPDDAHRWLIETP